MARPSRGRARGGRPPSRAVADDDTDEDPPPFVDLYAALELAKGASGGAIKKAYRALALRWHPDKNAGDAEAHARFQDISKAYAVLSDPTKRAYYDQTGDVEDIDVSADDFVRTFVVMMDDLLGGGTIEDMLDGLGDADFASMPPFPFPKHLFPPGTFPENMRFSEAFPVPPAVAELVERERDLLDGGSAVRVLTRPHRRTEGLDAAGVQLADPRRLRRVLGLERRDDPLTRLGQKVAGAAAHRQPAECLRRPPVGRRRPAARRLEPARWRRERKRDCRL